MEPLKATLASGNPHKLAELSAALPEWELELLGDDELPPETGESYYENARAKARFARPKVERGRWVLGEDSGIEVDALGGRPGIHSARWAGPGEDHVEKLLAALEGSDEAGRSARYVCELVAVSPEGRELRGTGVLDGRIARTPRGSEGFGYDPVFIPVGEDTTVAELGNAWKRANSHRARAARALGKALRRSSRAP